MIPLLIYNSTLQKATYNDGENIYYFNTCSILISGSSFDVYDSGSNDIVTFFPRNQVIYSKIPLYTYENIQPESSSYSEFLWDIKCNTGISGDIFYLSSSLGYNVYQEGNNGLGTSNIKWNESHSILLSGSSVSGYVMLKNINENNFLISQSWSGSYNYNFLPEYGTYYELSASITSFL